jgi:hypothetical protein
MILAAAEFREFEPKYMEIYTDVMGKLDIARKRQLLYEQDVDKFRPLELAAKRGLFGLFRLILDTKGVYLQEGLVARKGLHYDVRYDLSEYEDRQSRSREMRHPLRMIHFVKTNHMESFQKYVEKFPPIEKWKSKKLKQFGPFVIAWFIYRFCFLTSIVYYAYADFKTASEDDYGNDYARLPTSSTAMFALGLFLAVISFFMILFDIVEFVIDTFNQDKQVVDKGYDGQVPFVAHSTFNRYANFILCCLCITQYFLCQFRVIKIVYLSFKGMTLLFTLFSFLQILELLPWISSIAMYVQKIVTIFLDFIGIHTALRVIFYLFLLGTGAKLPKEMADLKYFGGGVYGVFLMDTGGGLFGNNPPTYINIIHHVFFFVSGIILVNMLLTMMTDSLAQMSKFKHLILTLRRLEMVILFEKRCAMFCWPFYCMSSGISPFTFVVTRISMPSKELK